MPRGRAICQGVHLASVSLWLGATVMTGVAAAIAFPTMKGLDPALPDFAAYPTDHWMIAAGAVMNKVFAVLDYASVALAVVAAQALVIAAMPCGLRLSAPSSIVRLLALAVAVGALGYSLFMLRPEMNAHLLEFHSHAMAGRLAEADAARSAFDALHPPASNALGVIAIALVVLVFMGIWSLATDPASDRAGGDDRGAAG